MTLSLLLSTILVLTSNANVEAGPFLDTCPASSIDATTSWQGSLGTLVGAIELTNLSDTPCLVQGVPSIRLLDGERNSVDVIQALPRDTDVDKSLVILGRQAALVSFTWRNYCGSALGPFELEVRIGNGDWLQVPLTLGNNNADPPRCDAPTAVSTFEVGAVQLPDPIAELMQSFWLHFDLPIITDLVERGWIWGATPLADIQLEPYDSVFAGQRWVQYFEKGRLEIRNAEQSVTGNWYFTGGLLAVELITGQIQIGDASFRAMSPAEINVAGDFYDPKCPTYASFAKVLNQSPYDPGQTVTQRINRSGDLTDDSSLTDYDITIAFIDDITNHAIVEPFWNFMTSEGVVYEDGQFLTDALFINAYFATVDQ